eukprot:Selendium_serpulae@DN5443_c0_g1_i4.p1
MEGFTQACFDDSDRLINLTLGYPPVEEIPSDVIRQAASRGFGTSDQSFFLYQKPQGYSAFREALSTFLSSKYQRDVEPETIMATNGCTGAIQLILGQCAPGDVVLVEKPTYFLARAMFEQAHLRIVDVPFETDGVDVVELETLARKHEARLFYTVPTCHNPTGRTTSHEKRCRIAELANSLGFTVVADETYQLLSFPGITPPPPMFYFDDPNGCGRVISIGSFSKIVAPALRLGWIQANKKIIHLLLGDAFLKSGGVRKPQLHKQSTRNHSGPSSNLCRDSAQLAKRVLSCVPN